MAPTPPGQRQTRVKYFRVRKNSGGTWTCVVTYKAPYGSTIRTHTVWKSKAEAEAKGLSESAIHNGIVGPPKRRERGSGMPRQPESRQRIQKLLYSSHFCQACSVGTRADPIPTSNKRAAEFGIEYLPRHTVFYCRACAMQFATDFANQIDVLAE